MYLPLPRQQAKPKNRFVLNTKRYPQYKSKKYAIYQITVFSSLITALHIPFRFFKTLGNLKISRQISEKDAELTRRIILIPAPQKSAGCGEIFRGACSLYCLQYVHIPHGTVFDFIVDRVSMLLKASANCV